MKAVAPAMIVVLLLSAAGAAQTSATANEGLKSLADSVGAALKEHREFYLRIKTTEQAAKLPAMLWHVGDYISQGGDLTADFAVTFELGANRNAAKLQAVADKADAAAIKTTELGQRATAAATAAKAMAATIRKATQAGPLTPIQPDAAPLPSRETEPGLLLGLAADALAAQTPDAARAVAALDELAAQLDRLADLDRWAALNGQWLSQLNAWSKTEGLSPRTLCYSIQARGSEMAILQSRVEDLFSATDAEKVAWAWTLARAVDAKTADAARPVNLAASVDGLRKAIADARSKEVALAREIDVLCHQRKTAEATGRRVKEYLPLAAGLEFFQREEAILARLAAAKPGDALADEATARPLSLTSRAALASVAAKVKPKTAERLRPVLADLLKREYLSSYIDLCLYQSAVMDTTAALAARLDAYVALHATLSGSGLADLLHPMHGVVSTGLRGDNAYDSRIMAWAAKCDGSTPMERFTQARDLVNAFYREHGYNQDQPVNTLRDALDSGLVDCIAASHLHGSVAASAGVTGIVPVRLWREKTGHSFLGLRTVTGLMMLDPLNRAPAIKYPEAAQGALTIETAVMSFGSYMTDDVVILKGNQHLSLNVPYLKDKD
jgi:hypothetical protein